VRKFSGQVIPYDATYKVLIEVMVDKDRLLNGFKVHCPITPIYLSAYREAGIDMRNCSLDLPNSTIQPFCWSIRPTTWFL
jgi:hypothetical protein